MNNQYASTEPARVDIDQLRGATLLEFGSPGCGYCRAAQPSIEAAMAEHPDLRHIKIADGSGRPLGRSFRITLWPTLVFIKDGDEISRLVRPAGLAPIRDALAAIDPMEAPGG